MTATHESHAFGSHATTATLPPPENLMHCIVTLRMPAHSRSPNQQEYFAPAVVLAQYEPNGEIDALVWDSSAGSAFMHGFAIRDVGIRDIHTSDGTHREQYVIQSNIGAVLFAPGAFERMTQEIEVLSMELHQKHRIIRDLIARVTALESAATAPASAPVAEPLPAAPIEAKVGVTGKLSADRK